MGVKKNFSSYLLVLFILTISASAQEDERECIYGIYVQTGSGPNDGTSSNISLSLSFWRGPNLVISNLKEWGLTGPDYQYFQKGQLDLFSGKGPCSLGMICYLSLTSDVSGPSPGWYVSYVEAARFGVDNECSTRRFLVEKWLDKDSPSAFVAAICPRNENKRAFHSLKSLAVN